MSKKGKQYTDLYCNASEYPYNKWLKAMEYCKNVKFNKNFIHQSDPYSETMRNKAVRKGLINGEETNDFGNMSSTSKAREDEYGKS